MVRRSERKPVGEMQLVASFPTKLYFIEPKESKWSSGSKGTLHIFKKEDEARSKYLVCCAPTEKEFNSAQMNAFEQPGGLNAVIHSSVAVSYAEDDKKKQLFLGSWPPSPKPTARGKLFARFGVLDLMKLAMLQLFFI